MQLDRTEIAIRARPSSELLDLALRVSSVYAGPLLLWTGIVALPLAVWNWWCVGWIVSEEYSAETIFRYSVTLGQLMILEAPWATLATTLFLGRTVFQQPTSAQFIFTELRRFLPRILWTELLRGSLVGMLLSLWVQPDWDRSSTEYLLTLVCGYVLLARVTRPFMNEIVLLERNPLRSADPQRITVRRRSRALHGPSGSDLLGRSMTVMTASILLAICLTLSLWFIAGILTSQWRWGPLMVYLFLPLALWLVVIYATVARFLNYLDLRIRREGWEVELRVRAAANEWKGQPT